MHRRGGASTAEREGGASWWEGRDDREASTGDSTAPHAAHTVPLVAPSRKPCFHSSPSRVDTRYCSAPALPALPSSLPPSLPHRLTGIFSSRFCLMMGNRPR